MSAEARLKQLGIVLPELMVPVANYLPYRIAGNILYLAGQGPRENGKILLGKVGTEVSIEEGYRRARLTGLGMLSAIKAALGTLDRVDFIVKLLGMVNAPPDFKDQPKVINGCSDLFVEVFGDAGQARPLGGRHGLAAERHVGRDRSHHCHQALKRDPEKREPVFGKDHALIGSALVKTHITGVPACAAGANQITFSPSVASSLFRFFCEIPVNKRDPVSRPDDLTLFAFCVRVSIRCRRCGGRRFDDDHSAIPVRNGQRRAQMAQSGRAQTGAFRRSLQDGPLEALLHPRAVRRLHAPGDRRHRAMGADRAPARGLSPRSGGIAEEDGVSVIAGLLQAISIHGVCLCQIAARTGPA